MNSELLRRYRRDAGRPMLAYNTGAVGMVTPRAVSAAARVAGEACVVTGYWQMSTGALGLTVAARVPDDDKHPADWETHYVNLPAADVLTVIPTARAFQCPDLNCPNEQPSTDREGNPSIPDVLVCWAVRHADGSLSHGWNGPADAAAVAHTYPTAPAGALLDLLRPGALVVELEGGWAIRPLTRS